MSRRFARNCGRSRNCATWNIATTTRCPNSRSCSTDCWACRFRSSLAAGADAVTYARALARIGREGTGVRTFFSGHTSIGQYPILHYGNRAQHEKYLRASTAGQIIMAFGLTEPDAGSNPLEMTSEYRLDGDRFLLNGVKYLISNGSVADVVVAFAYPAGTTGAARRISAFIVETAGATFVSEELHSKPGMFTANTGMFEMSDHPVPVANLLGEEEPAFASPWGRWSRGDSAWRPAAWA